MTTREDVLTIARSWIDTPYKHQASMKGAGCDCLGLMRGVFREVNELDADPERIPPYRRDWYERTERDMLLEVAAKYFDTVTLDDTEASLFAKAADLLVFRMKPDASAKHCAILTGPDTMIHAFEGHRVVEVNMGDYWWDRVVGVFRFKGLEG